MQTKAANQKFIALSDPARLDIVRHLAQGSKTAGEILKIQVGANYASLPPAVH